MSAIKRIIDPPVRIVASHLCSKLAYPLPIDSEDAGWSYLQEMKRAFLATSAQCQVIQNAYGAALYAIVGIATKDIGERAAFSVMEITSEQEFEYLRRYVALWHRLSPRDTTFPLVFVLAKQGMLD